MHTNHTSHNFSRKLVATLALSLFCAAPALAEEEKPTANLTVAALSQYIFRGFEQGKDSLVVEPSLTVNYLGFSANVWGNLDTNFHNDDSKHWQETDLTLSYSKSFDKLGLTGGYIYYGYGLGNQDTQEFFVSAAYDTLLKPTLTIYRDIDNLAGWYVTMAISHSLPLADKLNLDLGAKISYLKAESPSSYSDNGLGLTAYSAFHDGVLSAAINFPINSYVTVTPQLAYSFPLSGNASDLIETRSFNGKNSDFIYGGVAMTVAF